VRGCRATYTCCRNLLYLILDVVNERAYSMTW
jgi:hypothetical protein